MRITQALSDIYKSQKNKSKEINYYFKRGGLPGICFIQNDKLRESKIKD